MNRVRELLRNEYSGAVAIGFLLAQAIGTAVGLIMRPINFYLERAAAPRRFGHIDTDVFAWGTLVGPLISILLTGMFIVFLLQWLYLSPIVQEVSTETQDEEDADDPDGTLA